MKWLRRLRTLISGTRVDDEIQRELEFHLSMESAERERRGESTGEARRLARAEFGSALEVREAVRDARGLTFWDSLRQDLRFGVRLLARQPSFTAMAVTMLALGIGANTAVFTVVNTFVLKPRVGHADGDLVGVYSRDTAQVDQYRAFSYPDYAELRERRDVFASLSAHNFALVGVADGDATRRVLADIATSDFFDTFGAPVLLGRAFTAAEERPGADVPVAILSYPVWQRMGGRPDVLSQIVRINSREFRVVGVAQKGFGGSMVFATPELWLPTGVYDTVTNDFFREGLSAHLSDRNHYNLVVVGRLRPGVTSASLGPALDVVSHEMAAALPAENGHHILQLAPLSRVSVSTRPPTGDDSTVAGMTMGVLAMAAVVLLVVSFNLANMLLARNSARRKEFAIRLAIGGKRSRLIRQLLTEGLVLAFAGGVAGLFLAGWTTRLLIAVLTPISPISFSLDATPDWRVLAAVAGYCTLSTVLFGLLPARRLARTDPGLELKGHAGELGDGRSRMTLPNLLVMAQLALSLVLISVAALFMRGASEAARATPGFTFDRGVLAQIDPGLAGYDTTRSREFYARVLDRLRARPDVAAASVATLMPFSDMLDGRFVQKAGAPLAHTTERDTEQPGLVEATFTGVGAGYFDALGLSLASGRDFTLSEERGEGGPTVAIIDAALSEKLFGAESPIGRPVQYSTRNAKGRPVVMTVVGVAPPVRDDLFSAGPSPHLYVPFGSNFQTGSWLHVRTRAASGEAEAGLLPSFRESMRSVDPNVPVLSLQTRALYRDRGLSLAVVRIGAAIFLVFGALALGLAALGIYGVKAYVVSRRTREIGIRVALGATPSRVVWMVVRDGLVLSAIGLVVGLLLSSLVGTAMRVMTYQGRTADAVVLASAFSVLVASALIASWLPARRATRITPLRALRD